MVSIGSPPQCITLVESVQLVVFKQIEALIVKMNQKTKISLDPLKIKKYFCCKIDFRTF